MIRFTPLFYFMKLSSNGKYVQFANGLVICIDKITSVSAQSHEGWVKLVGDDFVSVPIDEAAELQRVLMGKGKLND